MDVPKLIEEKTGNYLINILQKCHQTRIENYSFLFNIVITMFFIILAGITLYLCATRKKTVEQQYQQTINDQKYILNKIKEFKDIRKDR